MPDQICVTGVGDRLFQIAVNAVVEAVVDAALRDEVDPEEVGTALETIVEPFIEVWIEHCRRTLRVSTIDAIHRRRTGNA